MTKISLTTRNSGKTTILFIVVIAIAVALGVYLQQRDATNQQMPSFEKLKLLPSPKSLGEVDFQSHNGSEFNKANLEGRWTILFFAFTNCPDICPSTLHTLKQVKANLNTAGVWDAFQLAMVTVDPERDSLERLAQYVPFFDEDFIGLRGDLDYTTKFAKNLGILFFKGEVLENGSYEVDHGASLILVNPDGNYAGVIGAPHAVDPISRDLRKLGNHALKHDKINALSKNDPAASIEEIKTTLATETSVNTTTGLKITDAWIRSAPPGAPAMAGYATISNLQNEANSIIAVSSPLFEEAMIHNTIIEDGIASMDHIDELEIAPQASAILKPLGTHLMLMEPLKPLNIGDIVPLHFELSSGETFETTFIVKEPSAL